MTDEAQEISLEGLDAARACVREVLADLAPRLRGYADVRIEVSETLAAYAEDGSARQSGREAVASMGVRVIAGSPACAGFYGELLGPRDIPELARKLKDALRHAGARAIASSRHKAASRERFPNVAGSLADLVLAEVPAVERTIRPEHAVDPRSVSPQEAAALAADVSRELAARYPDVRFNAVSVETGVRRQVFASSDGSLIDQWNALTEGDVYLAAGDGEPVELYDTTGHQRGWEVLSGGVDEPLVKLPALREFALALAADACELAKAPRCPTTDRPVAVVTDPNFNALLNHEIIGHPTELDRALKMETSYAGRSWFLSDLARNMIGRQIASPLVSAFSDPSLPGYGHYEFDDEGAPGKRVVLIEDGVLRDFMNSRATAAAMGVLPNGHYTATDASLVGLVRMSVTAFVGGKSRPEDILGDLDEGYYLSGMRVPSIAESRENFRISAQGLRRPTGGVQGAFPRRRDRFGHEGFPHVHRRGGKRSPALPHP
ncbi:MAG: TldD/PmbA family protein [Planctomycetota bacterium]